MSASEVVGEGATVVSVPVELEQRRLGVHLDEHAASLVREGGVDAPREEKLLGGGLDGGVVSGRRFARYSSRDASEREASSSSELEGTKWYGRRGKRAGRSSSSSSSSSPARER